MQSKKWDSHVRPIKERITDESHQSKSEKLLWLGSKNRVAIAAVMQPKSKNWTLRAQRMMTAEFWVVTTTNDVNQKGRQHLNHFISSLVINPLFSRNLIVDGFTRRTMYEKDGVRVVSIFNIFDAPATSFSSINFQNT